MSSSSERAVAIVAVGGLLPDAPDAATFWSNILNRRYSITETPPDRWSIADYYDPDPFAPDKTYSKIGGWVKDFQFNWQHFRIPPKVAGAMDQSQQWAVTVAEQVLADYGYPDRLLDTENTGVILGTAMGGELHYLTQMRIAFPEYANALGKMEEFQNLPEAIQRSILENWHKEIEARFPPITEDSMPGELANIIAGRVANVFNLRGPNFITDAACAASLAAVDMAVELLVKGEVNAVLTGGVDRNMGVQAFVKFCKIGALSPSGSRPFAEGADGFVMGEGAAMFLLKRLEDAEQDGDRIYAVIRGVGGSSDGKGKGIYAPNPIGQRLAIQRAWQSAGLDPATCRLIEAHGTSTRVGDVAEAESLCAAFGGAPVGSIGLGSVKSNIGHLKSGAGAAGLLKAALAVYHKILPPTLNVERPNPNINFASSPFFLIREAREWKRKNGLPRRCGVCANGFGGTNFHIVLEEHLPGELTRKNRSFSAVSVKAGNGSGDQPGREKASESEYAVPATDSTPDQSGLKPLRGILALGADNPELLKGKLTLVMERVKRGWTPTLSLPEKEELARPERLVIDFADHNELLERMKKAEKALALDSPQLWKSLQAQGVFRGKGERTGKLVFLFTGQGSQYLNMGRDLMQVSDLVANQFEQADRVLLPILGKPLTEFIFIHSQEPELIARGEANLMQTAICQPAVLTLDIALFHLLSAYGFKPDLVMGHSLGEYAALIASGAMRFEDALTAAAARGREMAAVQVDDNGWMAAVMAPYPVIEETLKEIDGYVVAANINSQNQCVIGGASQAVEAAIDLFQKKGFQAFRIPVSHAFHTRIVAPAAAPLRKVLDKLTIHPPSIPMVANVTGEFYPADTQAMLDLLERHIASPVQWMKGLETLFSAGGRMFVEVGPKKALRGLAEDVLGEIEGVSTLFTCHPKAGELPSFNQALCGLYAAGYPGIVGEMDTRGGESRRQTVMVENSKVSYEAWKDDIAHERQKTSDKYSSNGHPNLEIGDDLAQVLAKSISNALSPLASWISSGEPAGALRPYDRRAVPSGSVIISGTGLGLPGIEKPVMDPENVLRILRGEQFVDQIPERFRRRMVEKRIVRVVKAEDGSGSFEVIDDQENVIRLAGRPGYFDLVEEYGVSDRLVKALDITTQLAMAAGLDALREAGIPLVQSYRRASTGKYIPDRWGLPEALKDETGVIFASAFPGGNELAREFERYFAWENRVKQLELLQDLMNYTTDPGTLQELKRRIDIIKDEIEKETYEFDRNFLFRVLSMGHSQFAEYIGARGPNTHVNGACAGTAQAMAIAEDWIRTGRCRRVIVIAGDCVTSDQLLEWVGAGFLSLGAAATDDRVEDACIPFDRRRHGTIMGMGACAMVIESEDAVRERGMRGIVELLDTETHNSAFHPSRLDSDHIAQVMDSLITTAEMRFGVDRLAMASQMVFMSHETYTPARGGSASAEVVALRKTFGEAADEVVVANTKGFTGHAMGVGVEDVIAIKILEHGIVPPVPNFKVEDPSLGPLNLSRGWRYPVQYALHLAAGFGSQIAMILLRKIPGGPDRISDPLIYQYWLDAVSGCNRAETEVVKRTLRVKPMGAPHHAAAPSTWQVGTGPRMRAPVFGTGGSFGSAPAHRRYLPAEEEKQVVSHHLEPVPSTLESLQGSAFSNQPKAVVGPEPLMSSEIKQAPGAEVSLAQTEGFTELSVSSAQDEIPASSEEAIEADPITTAVLEIVAEKTGYPVEMLELDLDLEADLGIDTVKQAETFLAIRETFGFERPEGMRLRDYPTLAHVIEFVREMRPDLAGSGAANTFGAAKVEADPQVNRVADEAGDPITEAVIKIVAEKTGYPVEMLELDLDLEADLGIDTVKQAETFLAIRETFGFERPEGMRLRDYPTLAHVIEFVREMRSDLERAEHQENNEVETEAESEISGEGLKEAASRQPEQAHSAPYRLEDADRFPRRVPVPTLRPALKFFKPTGVALGQGSRILIGEDESGVAQVLAAKLSELGAVVYRLDTTKEYDEVEAAVEAWAEEGPIQGVFWLPAQSGEPPLQELDLATWKELNRRWTKNLFRCMQKLLTSSALQPGSSAPFLISAVRLGGLHGYGPEGGYGPLGGAVSGFTKAYQREHPEVLVKVVDFEQGKHSPEEVATRLIDEALYDPETLEVGYWLQGRYGITFSEKPAAEGQPGLDLNSSSVFLITGAAGGVTSEVIRDLAGASGGRFYLLDLIPKPDTADQHIALFRQDREALKKELIRTAKAAGEKITPAQVEKRILSIERQEALLSAIESIEKAGGFAEYYQADLLDPKLVHAVIENIRQREDKLDVLVHAAGVEISRSLAEKDPSQFDLVFDVKVDGIFNLLKAARDLPIGALVLFSSVAGRFGNAGQCDYSAANDLLCKLATSHSKWRPETRVIAIDWTAWSGAGMATRGSIPKIMEAAGIDMLPLEVGAPTVRRELVMGGFRGEVLIAGQLGKLIDEADPGGGLDQQQVSYWSLERKPPFVMIGEVKTSENHAGICVQTRLDPCEQPFLYDHAMDGTPLLPGVMGMEAFAELAETVTELAGIPKPKGIALKNVDFLLPFKFFRNKPQTPFLNAQNFLQGENLVVRACLRSFNKPGKKGLPVQEKVHFTGEVLLTFEAPPAPQMEFSLPGETTTLIPAEKIYEVFFHGPAYRVLEGVKLDGNKAIGCLAADLPPDIFPAEAAAVIAPRLVELCFQTAGVWEIQTRGVLALPQHVDLLQIYSLPEDPSSPLYTLVHALDEEAGFDAFVADQEGKVYLELKGYRTVPLPLKAGFDL